MIHFAFDYAEGAHEGVLRRLFETNLEQTAGYGEDPYCRRAQGLIRQLCRNESLEVHFLVGGTQTNTTVIAAALRPHQGVIAASSGHINVHESGAIESTGHKVLAVPSRDGKLSALDVRRVYQSHWEDETREHMVHPGMVYRERHPLLPGGADRPVGDLSGTGPVAVHRRGPARLWPDEPCL